jgi:hypothetical protein
MRYSTRMRGRIGCTLFELGIHTCGGGAADPNTYNGVSLKYFLFDCEWHCCMRYGAPAAAAHSLIPAEQEFKLHNKITEKFLPFAWRALGIPCGRARCLQRLVSRRRRARATHDLGKNHGVV